ncbi:MAG: (2Fe-2S) ferredoxin domain-containing protein [Gemmataceae bacterium]
MDREHLQSVAAKLGIGTLQRHIFLCTGPSCCSAEEGQAAWERLKAVVKERGLTHCYRTKVGCLRVCGQGPIAVVYPEGTWYAGMSAERIERLVVQHGQQGRPVAEWTFAVNPLPTATDARES